MSDLISRSELLKRFLVDKDGHRIPERDCDNFEVTVSIKDVKTIIKEQPTAYDIDKVVEEFRKASWEETDISTVIYIDDAIEIVKQGGVADDVCEWKYSGNVFISCNYKRFTDLHSFDYCPYCGNKIKVVDVNG